MSGVMNMNGDISLNMNNLKQGSNKLNLTIGSNSYSLSFQTYDAEYFGNEEGTLGAITKKEYQNIYFNLEGEKAYNAAKEAGEIDSDALKAEAYEKALWLNPEVRNELISKTINTKAADAQKAKDAAFLPKGKAKEPQKELTLREEIAKNMAAFLD